MSAKQDGLDVGSVPDSGMRGDAFGAGMLAHQFMEGGLRRVRVLFLLANAEAVCVGLALFFVCRLIGAWGGPWGVMVSYLIPMLFALAVGLGIMRTRRAMARKQIDSEKSSLVAGYASFYGMGFRQGICGQVPDAQLIEIYDRCQSAAREAVKRDESSDQ